MSSYLLNRKSYYHFRILIPSDLASLIPATELVMSLKTKNKQAARVIAFPYQHGIRTDSHAGVAGSLLDIERPTPLSLLAF